VDLGHRSIAHLAGGLELSTGWTRHRAFSYAMQRHGLQAEPNLIAVCGTLSEDQGAQATLDLLDRGKPFTAVVAANDLIALGCLDALAQRGLTCPGEVSVVGYNDMRFADKLQPPLTTIRVPQYELGVEAARMLLDQLAGRLTGRTPPPRLSLLQPKLIVRGSTAPAPPPFIRAGN
jgi:LacI family transcriptional regulator